VFGREFPALKPLYDWRHEASDLAWQLVARGRGGGLVEERRAGGGRRFNAGAVEVVACMFARAGDSTLEALPRELPREPTWAGLEPAYRLSDRGAGR
jgi:hypothetical protein